jgi:serine phosphatase RsbU (regulator of sigma subunit)
MPRAPHPSDKPYVLWALLAVLFLISSAYRVLDEQRLREATMSGRALAPKGLIGSIMAAADAFAGSAPQRDDMTLVVARCM